MDIEQSLNQTKFKADISFYMAFKDRINHHTGLGIVGLFKAIIFSIFIPINIYVYSYNLTNDLMMRTMIVNLSASLYEVIFIAISFKSIFGSVLLYLDIAQKIKHNVSQEIANQFSNIQSCSSTTIYYAQSNLRPEDCTEQTKKLLLNITINNLTKTIKLGNPFYRNNQSLSSLFSFASMILSIVALSTQELNSQNKTILAIYVVLVGLSQIKLVVAWIIIVLSPLICILLIAYCCCCKSAQDQPGKYINLPIKIATTADMMNAGGDCSICFQSIVLNDEIYVLTCSDKHIFHSECLRHWTKVKSNCPICRHEIQMSNNKIYEQSVQNGQPIVQAIVDPNSNQS